MTHLVVIPCSRSASRRGVDAMRSVAGAVRARLDRSIAPLAVRAQRLPAWSWPLIAAASGWPTLAWTLRRSGDGSGDPFGIVAWIALGFVLMADRRRFDHPPRARRLLAAAGVKLIASFPIAPMPDPLRALLVTIAVVLALAAIIDDDEPFLPYAGFALLAWPLPSSLQFYVGYPLRVVTAQATGWLLTVSGSSALTGDGRFVLVDVPSSGIGMAWAGCFTACFAAWLFRTSSRATSRRIPVVGLAILAGHVVRDTLLIALQVGDGSGEQSIRDGIGLVTSAIVCAVIVAVFARCRDRVRVLQRIRVESSGRFLAPARVRTGPFVVVCVFIVAAVVPIGTPRPRLVVGSSIETSVVSGAPTAC